MKTVKVRIAVTVDGKGGWGAVGADSLDDSESMDLAFEDAEGAVLCYWLEAELAAPETQTVQATVTEAQ